MPSVPRSPIDRFMTKVQQSPNGCWLWTGALTHNGYPAFYYQHRMVRAHRFSYEAHHGPIPAGLMVLHTCDTPACVNPAHLFLGTHDDNMQDRQQKGRTASGNANGMRTRPDRNAAKLYPDRLARGQRANKSHLTDADVREIRRLHAAGHTQTELAARFDVSQNMISRIVLHRNWTHVD